MDEGRGGRAEKIKASSSRASGSKVNTLRAPGGAAGCLITSLGPGYSDFSAAPRRGLRPGGFFIARIKLQARISIAASSAWASIELEINSAFVLAVQPAKIIVLRF